MNGTKHTPKAKPVENHYYLVAGEILFQTDAQAPVQSVPLNCLVMNPEVGFTLQYIGRAQQGLQAQFMKRLDGETVQIVDVVINNFNYLGYFTEEAFRATPPGMKLQLQDVIGHA